MLNQVIQSNNVIKVGFVDDEEEQILQLKSHFTDKENLNALYSSDPTEAMGWVIREEIDVLVFDMNLGGVNGIDFLEKARSLDQDIILILFSGYILDKEQSKRCRTLNVFPIKKHEGKDSLEDNIVRLYGVDNTSSEDKIIDASSINNDLKKIILDLASPLIADLQKLSKSNQEIKITIGEDFYSASQLIGEIESLSTIGKKFIEDYFSALKILKTKNPKGEKK
jgi:DNA-binding NtrC family response regulator